MKDQAHSHHASSHHRESGRTHSKDVVEPTLQIICLASGGGPSEDTVTGFLVRSLASKWARNSVLAVDPGSHLAAITRILENHFPRVFDPEIDKPRASTDTNGSGNGGAASAEAGDDSTDCSSMSSADSKPTTTLDAGPFAGLPFPHESARANALHVVRDCVSTYLISHPHLDHFSAFAINTAGFHNTSRPKRLAALPSTVNAIKAHIFNNIIWPNLTDEDGGVGFVTFQRLTEGGNLAVGEGRGKGYIEVCDGLCVKGMKISHGHCTSGIHRGSDVGLSEATVLPPGSQSRNSFPDPTSPSRYQRAGSVTQLNMPGTPNMGAAGGHGHSGMSHDFNSREVVVDSTAYFIRDDNSGREILFFGDVEPDSLSLNPRTAVVWNEAAPKIASGSLKAVVIECSYDDTQPDNILFGHLNPRHLIKELTVLAEKVQERRDAARERRNTKKRKRHGHRTSADDSRNADESAPATDDDSEASRGRKVTKPNFLQSALRPRPVERQMSPRSNVEPASAPAADVGSAAAHERHIHSVVDSDPPLQGFTVLIQHVKDTLGDGPFIGDVILSQLKAHDKKIEQETGVGLGCEFVLSTSGVSYEF